MGRSRSIDAAVEGVAAVAAVDAAAAENLPVRTPTSVARILYKVEFE